jgi:HAD superfamily hydrolase (TIGR01490 family)
MAMSVPGKRAAFFDLDGTLVPPPSLERRFAAYLVRRGKLGFAQVSRWLTQFLIRALFDFPSATEGNKAYLAGLPISLADDWAELCKHKPVPLLAKGLRRLTWHFAQGHKIFLISGTIAPLAVRIARLLPVPAEVCATELETCDGCWTGRIQGELISREAKARAIERLASQYHLNMEASYAYGDRYTDVPMLKSTGHPVAINPSFALERFARQREWPVLEWRKTAGRKATGSSARGMLSALQILSLRALRGRQ